MKQGILIYDSQTDRMDIRFGNTETYGGLHCGDCFEVLIGKKWEPTRIEMADHWYLIGIQTSELAGLRVRI